MFKPVASLPLLLADFTPPPFKITWRVDCTLGQTCHIQHCADHDPELEGRDFTCGTLSYDGHDGTEFALPNRMSMKADVKILAAALGTVLGTRDGIADCVLSKPGKESGNSVLVDYDHGWQTQYCHMEQGSVAVQKGQQVTLKHPARRCRSIRQR